MENGANDNKGAGTMKQLRRILGEGKRRLAIALAALLLVTALVDGYQHNRQRDITAYVTENAVAVMSEKYFENGEIQLSGLSGLSTGYLRENLLLQGRRRYQLEKESTAADTAVMTVEGELSRTLEVSLRMPRANTTLRWTINEPTMTAELVKSSIVTGESVYIAFSEPVDEAAVKKYLRIGNLDPEQYDVVVTGMVAEIRMKLDYYREYYNIYLPRDITNQNGIPMKESYRFEVAMRAQRDVVKRPFTVSMTSPGSEIIRDHQQLIMEFNTNTLYWPVEEVTVTAYQFPSVADYQKTGNLFNLTNKKFYDPAEMEEMVVVGSAHTKLRQGPSSITMENPGLGAYLLEAVYNNPLTRKTDRIRKTVLVSDLSVYAQSVNGETLLWLNSTTTGGPLQGHTVDFINTKNDAVLSGTTDSNGLVVLETLRNPYQEEDWFNWLQISDADGQSVYADTTDVLTWNWDGTSDRYFTYFYMDRGIYRPNDEIHFWGFLKAHDSNRLPTPNEVRVVFDQGGLEIEAIATVDENNIFEGTITLEKAKSSHYTVNVLVPYEGREYRRNEEDGTTELVDVSGERAIHSEYIEVKEFQKPLFTLEAESSKPYYRWDEDAVIIATPKFYDGTPLPNYELEYVVYDNYYGNEAVRGTVLTNDEGTAEIKFPAFQISSQPFAWRPATGRYQVMIKSDGENISCSGTYTYFPTDQMIRANTEVDLECKATLRAMVNRIDLSAVKTLEDLRVITEANYYHYNDFYDYDSRYYQALVGEAVDTTVTAQIVMNYYTYHGKYEEVRKSLTMEAKNGSADREIDLAEFFGVEIDTASSVRIEVSYQITDSQDRSVAYQQAAYKPSRSEERQIQEQSATPKKSEPQEPQFYKGYSFSVTNDNGDNAIGDYIPNQSYDHVWFNAGERFHLTMQYDGEDIPNGGRLLYTVIQDDIIESGFTTENRISFTQSTRYASNILIVGSYFDGENIHPFRDVSVGLATDSIRLTVETTTDKADYRPGEEATIRVKMTDANGAGVQGNACVSIVDESIFALREQYTEVLGTLYRDSHYYNQNVRKYATILRGVEEKPKGAAGKGEGGDVAFDSLRKNFKDTALFRNVRTDANGEAVFTFQLPDNITSWRITSLAIGDNLYAGQAQTNFITTQPFFISPVVSDKYIEGDDIALQVRGYGTALNTESEINFTVTMTGDNYSKTFTETNTAFKASHINFGQLPLGEYTLSATAQHGQMRDTVELPVTVISSNLELVVNRPVDLSKPITLNAMRYPITMSFYSKEHEAYFNTVSSLLHHYCMQASQRMSRYTAKQALLSFMNSEDMPRYLFDATDSVSDMQNSDGGIGSYPGSDSRVDLSAKILLVAEEQFNLTAMKGYFERAIDEYGYDLKPSREIGQAKPEHSPNRTNVCYAYLGLAALGEPVAQKIYYLLELPDSRPEHQALLVAALAYAQDDGALAAYNKYITPLVDKRAEGASIQYYNRFREGSNDRITAAAWIAASKLGHTDADQFAKHFCGYRWRISSLYEAMVYVHNYDKPVEPISFSYAMNGENHNVDLGLSGRMTMKMNQSGYDSFQMLSVPEDLACTAYYIGEPSEADIQTSENVQIKKTMTEIDTGKYNVTLTVTFGEDAEGGQYDISDWVPSNMRVYDITNYQGGDRWSATYETEGQKLYFRLWRDTGKLRTATITYTVREVFEANAMVDSTYIIHGDSGDSNFSARYRWARPIAHRQNEAAESETSAGAQSGSSAGAESTSELSAGAGSSSTFESGSSSSTG